MPVAWVHFKPGMDHLLEVSRIRHWTSVALTGLMGASYRFQGLRPSLSTVAPSGLGDYLMAATSGRRKIDRRRLDIDRLAIKGHFETACSEGVG